MKKRIIIEIESEEGNDRIEYYVRHWVKENFQDINNVKIMVENLYEN